MSEPTAPPPQDASPPPPAAPPPAADSGCRSRGPAAPPPAADSGNRTVMVILSYLGLLALIPLLMEKDDKEVQWHAKHGLVLTAAEIILFVGLSIVMAMLAMVSSGLGCLLNLLWPLIGLGIFVVHIVCMVKGVKGERFLVPGVSQYADRF